MKGTRWLLIGTVAALLFQAPAGLRAMEVNDRLRIDGYGNWAYGSTDGNAYMMGTDEGNYDVLEFALSVTAKPAERLSLHAQPFWELSEGEWQSSLDYAFGEYDLLPQLHFRIGRIKQPFGLLTEIYDVGVLHAFPALPQGIYGPAGFVSEGVNGIGASGRFLFGEGWVVQYDAYLGELETELTMPWAEPDGAAEAEGGEGDAGEAEVDAQDLVGGRIVVSAPESVVSLGVSAYSGRLDTESFGEEGEDERHSAWAAQFETELGNAKLSAEYARLQAEGFTTDAAYVEGAYRLSPHWRVAVRYDWSDTELDEGGGDVDASLLEHRDLGVAVDYVITPNFVLKLAWHQVEGNRFTGLDDEDEDQDEKTRLVSFGSSYSF